MANWIRAMDFPPIATCSITELGFIRVLAQATAYGLSVTQARTLLQRMKASSSFSHRFLVDTHDISHLPAWVKTAKQTTDGHLLRLAQANDAVLTTLDEKIPGAYVLPKA